VRRCADLNHIIRTYENDLIEFARLRNAIIHGSDSGQLIAEPHINIVELLEKIERLINTPPHAVDIIKSKDVITIDAARKLRDLITETGKSGHGTIPAYKMHTLVGVVRWRKFIEDIGNFIIANKDLDDFINMVSIEEYLRTYPQAGHFTIVSSHVTIEEVLTLFNQNRKLSCVIITPSGAATELPVGIITNADIMDLIKVIENY
jgi:predicted transcriptional regulator